MSKGKGRWVTEEELMTAVNRRIAALAQQSANVARGQGREEVARMWEGFVVQALAKVPLEDEHTRLRDAAIEAAERYVRAGEISRLGPPWTKLYDAIHALILFEREHKL